MRAVDQASAEVRRIRGRLGSAIRWTPADTAAIDAARRDLVAARAARLRAMADELSTVDES